MSRSGRFSRLVLLSGRRAHERSSTFTIGAGGEVAVIWIQKVPRVTRAQVTHTSLDP